MSENITRRAIKPEIASAYADYFLKVFNIDREKRETLKKAIVKACVNPELPITEETLNLSKDSTNYVYNKHYMRLDDISVVHKYVKTPCDFVEFIVEKIMDLNNPELMGLRLLNLEILVNELIKLNEIESAFLITANLPF